MKVIAINNLFVEANIPGECATDMVVLLLTLKNG